MQFRTPELILSYDVFAYDTMKKIYGAQSPKKSTGKWAQ